MTLLFSKHMKDFIMLSFLSLLINFRFQPRKCPFNPLSTNPTKWSNTLKQFVCCCWRIAWVCLIILQGWPLKGLSTLTCQFIMVCFRVNSVAVLGYCYVYGLIKVLGYPKSAEITENDFEQQSFTIVIKNSLT